MEEISILRSLRKGRCYVPLASFCVHIDRTSRCYRYHRDINCAVGARRPESARGRGTDAMHEQPQAMGVGDAKLSRYEQTTAPWCHEHSSKHLGALSLALH